VVVEKLLQPLVGVVDAKLFKSIKLEKKEKKFITIINNKAI
jgi:hypothetical protein